MALTITGKLMRSPGTRHGAVLDPDANFRPDGPEVWRVTWLPGRALTRGQATGAMMIAQAAGRLPAGADPEDCSDPFWTRVASWAADLGLSGPAAVVRAPEPPQTESETEARQ
jgi:hypothetical protein